MILQFSAQIEKLTANSDKTVSIRIGSQELSSGDVALLVSLFEKQIWIALAETQITKEDLHIPEVIDEMDKKSPSQRLRDRMFVYFKERQPAPQPQTFDEWYRSELERIGEKYLERIQ